MQVVETFRDVEQVEKLLLKLQKRRAKMEEPRMLICLDCLIGMHSECEDRECACLHRQPESRHN